MMIYTYIDGLPIESENNFLSTLYLHLILYFAQMLLVSRTLQFSEGTIVADSQEEATGLMVVIAGSITVEVPHAVVSDVSATAQQNEKSKTVLYVLTRGYCTFILLRLHTAEFVLTH
jgi:hypothetical protein